MLLFFQSLSGIAHTVCTRSGPPVRTPIGKPRIGDSMRDRVVELGLGTRVQRRGSVTIGIGVGYPKLPVSHAAAVHGMPMQVEPIETRPG